MRKLLAVSLVVFAVLLPSLMMAADAPALPDYTKAPFQDQGKVFEAPVPEHPELGVLEAFVYITWNVDKGEKPQVGAEKVIVGKDKDGNLKYAVYSRLTDQGVENYAYLYKDGKWVYEP